MTSSEGSFSHGDDFVAARLSVDIPAEGIASIRELTQEIERFRVGVESAARGTDNWNQYLNATAEAAERAATMQQNLLDTVQRVTEMQQRVTTGGGAASPATGTAVPQGYSDPFSSTSAGMGRALPGELPPVNLDAVSGQIDAMRRTDPRTYLNMQSARGNLQPGDITTSGQLEQTAARVAARDATVGQQVMENPPAGHVPGSTDTLSGIAGGIGRGGQMANQVMNELGPGGSIAGLGRAALTGLDAMSSLSDRGSTSELLRGLGASGLVKGAGIAGGVLTAGLAANGAFQSAGEQIQGYRNMGSVRGGGAAEGFGQEMAVRSMAMNPFLTTEQSRQIIQSALTEGYSGKQFDSVTQFMSENLRSMNLSVADSVKMLRKEVNEGGQSVTGLAANLGILKEMSKTGATSLPDLQANFMGTSRALVDAGVDAPGAERAALLAGQTLNDDTHMGAKGLIDQIMQSAASSASGQANILAMAGKAAPAGARPDTYFARMPTRGYDETIAALKSYARMAQQSSGGDFLNAVADFRRLINQNLQMQMTGDQAKILYQSLISGEDLSGDAHRKLDEDTKTQTSVHGRSMLSAIGGSSISRAASIGSDIQDELGTVKSSIADFFSGNASRIPGRFKEFGDRVMGREHSVSAAGARYEIPMLDEAVKQYGPGGIEIVDSKGKSWAYNPDNKEMMDRLSSGDLTWRPAGSNIQGGIKVSDTPQGKDNFKDRVAQVQGSVTLGLTPEAQRLLAPQGGSTIRLTPHEQQANAGYGNATPNNAPPGEGPITRGAR